MKYRQRELRTRIMYIMPVAVMLLFFALPAQANPMRMSMGMSHHGQLGHMLRPHNAAAHFLAMAKPLQLTGKQINHLIKLRDAWIKKNSVNAAQLAAVHADLQRLIMADPIDLKTVDRILAQTGSLESDLWHAFALQLHDIKSMLTAKQKQQLAQMHRRMGRRGMEHKSPPGK
ncbi:MAG: hypothetical protein Q9M24_03665 [Mariprofundaceae bacterium]|nr:hypothetical protein [Mariprofundaceae bacterium]